MRWTFTVTKMTPHKTSFLAIAAETMHYHFLQCHQIPPVSHVQASCKSNNKLEGHLQIRI